MFDLKNEGLKFRYAIRNVVRLPMSFFLIFLFITISSFLFITISSFLLMNVLVLLESSNQVMEIANIPYKEYHLVVPTELEDKAKKDTYVNYQAGKVDIYLLESLKIVEDIVMTEESVEKTNMQVFKQVMEDQDIVGFTSSNEKNGKLRVIRMVDSSENMDFKLGDSVLIHGRHVSKNDTRENHPVAIIDEALMELNNLELGDTIQLGNESRMGNQAIIVGVYKTMRYSETMIQGEEDIPLNKIYVSYCTAQSDLKGDFRYSGVFVKLSDGAEGSKLSQHVKDKFNLDMSFLSVSEMNSMRNKGITAISNISYIIVVLTVALSFLVMSNILYANIMSRKREIGILKALGLKGLVSQFVYEYFIVLIPSLFIGIGIGFQTSKNFSLHMIQMAKSKLSLDKLTQTTDDMVFNQILIENEVMIGLTDYKMIVQGLFCFGIFTLITFIIVYRMNKKISKLEVLTILQEK